MLHMMLKFFSDTYMLLKVGCFEDLYFEAKLTDL